MFVSLTAMRFQESALRWRYCGHSAAKILTTILKHKTVLDTDEQQYRARGGEDRGGGHHEGQEGKLTIVLPADCGLLLPNEEGIDPWIGNVAL
jgi:hypothetical protein